MVEHICQTVAPSRENFTPVNSISLTAANTTVCAMNILTNSFLIYAIIKTSKRGDIYSKFILCLSISDCCVGIIVQPMGIMLLTYFAEHNCEAELAAQFVAYIFSQISFVMIMIVAFDRFLHMKYLHRYPIYMTEKRAKLLVAINVMLAFCIASCSVVASLHRKFVIFNVILVVIDAFVVTATYVFYAFTYMTVYQHTVQMRNEQLETRNVLPFTTKSVPKHNLELAKTIFFIFTAVTICYLPYFVLGLVWSYYNYPHSKRIQLHQTLDILVWWSFIFTHLNSTLNTIILSARNKRIVRLLKDMLLRWNPLKAVGACS